MTIHFTNMTLRFMATRVRGYCSNAGVNTILEKMSKDYSCGIAPWKIPEKPVEKPPPPLPQFLVRPPCMPDAKRGRLCDMDPEGLYCPPCRIKYKYPSFSENIDFVPGGSREYCWWPAPPSCNLDGDMLKSLVRSTKCLSEKDF